METKSPAIAYLVVLFGIVFLGGLWYVAKNINNTIKTTIGVDHSYIDFLLAVAPVIMLISLVIWAIRVARGKEVIET